MATPKFGSSISNNTKKDSTAMKKVKMESEEPLINVD